MTHILRTNGMHLKSMLVCFVLFCHLGSFSQQAKNEDDLKKQAEKLFENEEYNLAYKLYAQLVSNYPKDPEYNYRLGVCMLYTEPDKKKPFSYLKIAVNSPKDAPKDAKFYLAKTYHINYQFDEAIKLYNEFKLIGSSSSIKKLQVDREIEACKNGKRLLSNITDLVVLTKKQLNEADYFRSYDVSGIGGKLLVKPDDFKSSVDKKKKEKSVIYLPKTGDKVFYSSYGETGDKGRDLYVKTKIAGGFSAPQLLPSSINTEYDEDYPFLHPNGKTLYFSSKGHNSMGGYDVFKTTYDDKTQTWSKPVNLEFPISSPDDDILFVTDSLEKTAYFSTGRYSPYGKIDVLKINIERQPINFAYLKGTVVKETVTQSIKSKITVKNLANNELVGVFEAEDNGNYKIELPNGGKFAFTVETPGIETQTQNVNVPVASSLKPYKQMISYDKKNLRITNYFDSNADDNYELIRDLIEKKAKLEMSDDATIANSGKTNSSLNAVSSGNPTVGSQNTTSVSSTQPETKNFNNEQLLEIAKTDAKEATEEASKLKQEAEDAFGLATQKNNEAQAIQKEADALLTSANSMGEGAAKKEALKKATDLKEDANIATDIANTAGDLAKKLEVDANLQKQEADLTNQYIKEIESVIKNKNNKDALAKLEQLQKQLNDLSKQKNQSDELYASLKAEGELKQNELAKQEKKKTDATNALTSINNEVKDLEKDLANESDNELKESIKAQIRELNAELELKNKEVITSTEKVDRLKNEVDGINKEIDLANKILNGKASDIASNPNTEGNLGNTHSQIATSTQTSNTTSNQLPNASETVSNSATGAYSLNYESITANYKKEIEKKATTKDELINQNDAIAHYNSDINELITLDKDRAAIALDPKDKKKLKDEIAKLEKIKTTNDKSVANNNQKLKQLDAITATATSTPTTSSNTTTNVVSATTSSINTVAQTQSITSTNSTTGQVASGTVSTSQSQEIENIKAKMDNTLETASDLFQYSNYKDPSSAALKEATVNKYNDALKTEATLKSQLASIEKTTQENTQTSTDLLTQAEALNDEALKMRQEVATKTGAEKELLQKQITEKEALAITTKLKAADVLENENKQQLELNKLNILELQKLMASKPNADMSQANMLINEALLNFKQADNMRQEAKAYPAGSAKLGGLSNAEEKEAEALQKQQKVLDLLVKENPNYQLKKLEQVANPTQVIADLTKKLQETSVAKTAAFTELSKLNQNELSKQGDKLKSLPAFNHPDNKASQELKTQSDVLKAEAIQIVSTQIPTTTNDTEKQKLLLSATNKEIEALKLLSEANQKLNTNPQSIATNTPTNSVSVATNTNSISIPTTTLDAEEGGAVTNTTSPTNNIVATNSATISSNNFGSEASKLKNGLSNSTEASLEQFNTYSNTEAIDLKNKAYEKISAAISQDKNLSSNIDNISSNAYSNSLSQQSINNLASEAEKLNDEAYTIRQKAAVSSGEEKENLLNSAIAIETKATDKKIEVAEKQQQLNNATYEANNKSLDELKQLAKGKPISELASIETQLTEAEILMKQSDNLRAEANAYPNNAAKLGGFSNAEEKEALSIQKQEAAIALYKKYVPNFKNTKPAIGNANPESVQQLNTLKTSINTNEQQHIDGLLLLADANTKEYNGRLSSLKVKLNPSETALKTKAINAYKQSQVFYNKAQQESDLTKKKKLLVDATKNGQVAINYLSQIAGVTNNGQVAVNNTNNTSGNNTTNGSGNNQQTTGINNSTNSASSNSTSLSNQPTATNTPTNSATTNQVAKTNNGVSDEANNLKLGLSNATEATLSLFSPYTNTEAIAIKNQALEKITEALEQDKALSNTLDNVVTNSINNASSKNTDQLSQESINSLTGDAEKLNDEALKLRQEAATKTGADKDLVLKQINELETKAIEKKIEAANKQEQLNLANYSANKESLDELEKLSKGKNITDLYVIEMQLVEAEIFLKQAMSLRTEANAYPNNATKLGDLRNAEEKEALAIKKQTAAIATYKKYITNYVGKKPNLGSTNPENVKQLNAVKSTININEQKHIDGLLLLADANTKEYNSLSAKLGSNLKPNDAALKTKAQLAYKLSQTQLTKAQQEPNLTKKKNTLVDAGKSGQDALSYLNQIGGNGNGQLANNTNTISNSSTNVQNGNTNSQTTNSNGRTENSNATNNNPSSNTKTVTANNATSANLQNTNGNGQIVNTTNTPTTSAATSTTSIKTPSTSVAVKTPTNNTQTTNNTITPIGPKTVLKVKEQELAIKNNDAYSDAKPIPINEKMQKGLYFKVQIGAFKQTLPNSTFKGLTPLSGETTNSGYIRYMAGNFGQYEDANAVKNDLKKLGYTDAFVVAYFDGERIPLLDAPEKTENNIEIKNNTNTSAGITSAANVAVNPFPTTPTEAAAVTDLEKINGLLYTIQVGIYSRPVAKGALYNLRPLYRETLPNGLYRYTAGIYNLVPNVLEDKIKVNNLGIKDAFASSYYNGKRIAFDEGRKLQAENSSLKMEAQNPIIFDGGQLAISNQSQASSANSTGSGTTSASNTSTTLGNPQTTNTVQPFSNGVTNAPNPTAENGVKADEAGISYKVQVGAYRNQVPSDVANKFIAIKTWPLSNVPINGLFIYTIGNFTGATFAKKLKDEAMALGITDAFVTVYKDGKKLYGAEASEYLNR